MKTIILFITCLTGFCYCHSRAEHKGEGIAVMGVGNSDTIHFKAEVQPILVQNCSPCHFTGGKMYERMPFDQCVTILRHAEGIVKRFNKKEREQGLLRQFISEHKIPE